MQGLSKKYKRHVDYFKINFVFLKKLNLLPDTYLISIDKANRNTYRLFIKEVTKMLINIPVLQVKSLVDSMSTIFT
jgi:hypothetical protein